MDIQLDSSNTEINQLIGEIIANGGPQKSQYEPLNKVLSNLRGLLANGVIKQQHVDVLTELPFLQTTDSIMGHIRNKPFGYAGDFKIIERIYTNDTSEEHYLWDRYSLEHVAAQAVRNRKDYFIELVKGKIGEQKFDLLNLASGPARDLKELYQQLSDPDLLYTDCVDMESQAVAYATELCQAHAGHINFTNQNILKHKTDKQYDCIWSAGLFDYFNDETFVMAIKRFKQWLKPGGEIVVGNFSMENPSRDYMEIIDDCHLLHRSPEDLKQLAIAAGFSDDNIVVESEPLRINLFLHLKG